METAYEETCLLTLWVQKHVPYPRNVDVMHWCGYGLRVGLEMLTDEERAAWAQYKAQAKAALGERFIPAEY